MRSLKRDGYSRRIFSDLRENWTGSSKDTDACTAVIITLKKYPLTRLQQLTGWGITSEGWLARILKMQWQAITGEQIANFVAADFLFNKILAEIKSAPITHPAWNLLATRVSAASGRSIVAAEMYRIAVDELFVDLHCGLFNGYASQQGATGGSSRQEAHLDYLKRLLELSEAPQETRIELMAAAFEDRCLTAWSSKQWDIATATVEGLLNDFPNERRFADLAATIFLEQAVDNMSAGDDAVSSRTDASNLQRFVQRLDKLCIDRPECVTAYDCSSRLHRIRGVRLANGGLPSDALLEIHKAQTYWPRKEVKEDLAKVGELIKQVEQHAAQQKVALSQNSRLLLTDDGLRIKEQARLGLGPAMAYLNSKEPGRISGAWEIAQIRSLWYQVGLAVPEERWDEQARKLFHAIWEVREIAASGTPSEFNRAWSEVSKDDADLSTIEDQKIRRYLEKGDQTEDESTSDAEVPMLPVATAAKSKGHEPFGYWLFSRFNPILKAQAALALALLLAAVTLGTWHAVRVHRQEQAWTNVETAVASGDDLAQVLACEKFYGTSPSLPDIRAEQAGRILSAALTRWFSNLPGPPTPAALDHLNRYRQISAAWQRAGGTQ